MICVCGLEPVDQLGRPHLVLADVGADAIVAALVHDPAQHCIHIVRHEHLGIWPSVLLLGGVLFLHVADVCHPGSTFARGQFFKHGLQHALGIAYDRHIHAHILADLGRIEVDMDDLGVRREARCLAGHAVVETPADIEQNIALLDRAVVMDPAVHARHAERLWMILGEGADAMQRGDDRDAGAIGQFAQFGEGFRDHHTASGHDQRLLGSAEQLDRLADLLAIAARRWLVARQIDLGIPVRDNPGVLHIFGDIDQHRTGPSGSRDMKCLLEDAHQVVDIRHQVVVLGDRLGDAGRCRSPGRHRGR